MEHLTAEQLRRAGKGILLGTVVAPLGGALLTILFAALLSVGIPDATIPLFAHLTILLGAALGGFFGGLLAGGTLKRVNPVLLRRLFGLVLLWAGVRSWL